jgi:hypothetical protein
MATVTLVLGEEAFTVASEPLRLACDVFVAGGWPARYRVQARIPLDHRQSFLEAIKGKDIQITNENVSGLSQLCAQFGFGSLSSKLSAFRSSPSFRHSADAEARS